MCRKFGENALYQICTTKCKNQTMPLQIQFLNATGNYQNFPEAIKYIKELKALKFYSMLDMALH